MPKQTFLNLPKEKADAILNAAIVEFSRTSYAEASINKIIQMSKIPRGSFYMYFENKEELYNYLLDKFFDFLFNAKLKLMKKNKGDIINTYIGLFDVVYKECNQTARRDFFRNVFINMTYKTECDFVRNEEYVKDKISDYYKLVDQEKLNIHNKDDLFIIDSMFMSILMKSILVSLKSEIDLKEVKKTYYTELALIKNGVYKKEEIDA